MHFDAGRVDALKSCQIGEAGWIPPLPDLRDFSSDEPEIRAMAAVLGIGSDPEVLGMPSRTDLRRWFSPAGDQQGLRSCAAHAAVSVIEYSENRAFGREMNGSRLFVYKTARGLMGMDGDTGAWLRKTLRALALLGVPPETRWPYVVKDFDKEPPASVYSATEILTGLRYFRHDPSACHRSPEQVLGSVKTFLAAGIPSVFGFFCFPSINRAGDGGKVPFPGPGEKASWGQAVVAAGYDDALEIEHDSGGESSKGALLIRNSWGEGWGERGYGWLPYDYVLCRLAGDFWSVLRPQWIESGNFGLML
ncbi:MAG: cysteine protease [candidate division Zixibacteria bacterium]|nr:cysteine protease [candidate division Zixibacteria bacterium]